MSSVFDIDFADMELRLLALHSGNLEPERPIPPEILGKIMSTSGRGPYGIEVTMDLHAMELHRRFDNARDVTPTGKTEGKG